MKKGKVFLASIAVILAAVLSIGGTLAYFTSITDTKTNVFTAPENSGDVFKAELSEPSWDAYPKDEMNRAVIHPGIIIPKDPTVTVVSDSEGNGAYIGVWAKFSAKAIAKMDQVNEVAYYIDNLSDDGIDYLWVNNFSDIIVTWYPSSTYKEGESATMFSGIKFPKDMTAQQLSDWSDLKIEVVGAAVSASEDIASAEEAKPILDELLKSKF